MQRGVCSCGVASAEECADIFREILAQEFGDVLYARVHRLTVDCYSLQHPDQYMKSGKSYAAHLTGICVALEYGNSRQLLQQLRRWLDGNKQPAKAGFPANFGAVTIAYVAEAANGAEHAARVEEWAAVIWEAYSDYQAVANEWIKTYGGAA